MRNILFTLCLACNLTVAGTAPTLPESIEHPWYFGLSAGAGFLNNNMIPIQTSFTTPTLPAGTVTTDYSMNALINHKTGYRLASTLGYRYSELVRLEAEFSLAQSNTNNALGFIPLSTDDITVQFLGNSSLRRLSLMFNALLDFPDVSQYFDPFIGLGLGVTRAKASLDGTFANVPDSVPLFTQRQNDTIMSYQLMTGFRYNVDNRKYVHFTARALGATRPSFYTNRLIDYAFDLGYSVILDMF